MSHKSWMKTVPTENCDILMTFAGQASTYTPISVSLVRTLTDIQQ